MRSSTVAAVLLFATLLPAQVQTTLVVTDTEVAAGGTTIAVTLTYAGSPNSLVILALSWQTGSTLLTIAPGVDVPLGLDPQSLVVGPVGITNRVGKLACRLPVGLGLVAHGQAFDLALASPVAVVGLSPVQLLVDQGGGVGCGVGDG